MNPKSNQSTGVIALQRISEVKLKQARAMRKEMTDAEHILWQYLRNRELDGLKFRRQQVIDGFIADFFCNELKLVVEVDGKIHNNEEQKKIDAHRRKVFESRGLQEMRFTNDDVIHNIAEVVNRIKQFKKNNVV